MKEHGMLYAAPMVRALLAGTKTQTRRLVKAPKGWRIGSLDSHGGGVTIVRIDDPKMGRTMLAPHGPVGRRLWVRETWAVRDERGQVVPRGTKHIDPNCGDEVVYRADDRHLLDSWRTPLHMPRWASRITLEVTRVRLERVQSITEEDARAEGVTAEADPEDLIYEGDGGADIGGGHGYTSPRSFVAGYERLWNTINGAGSWASNPWVWAYDFKRIS